MKPKVTILIAWLVAMAVTFEASATMRHHCPPANLAVTPSEGPGGVNLQWTHSSASACATINGFEIRVRTCVNGNNSTTYYYCGDGLDPMTYPLELPPGAVCSWKVRSTSWSANGDGERHSIWANGPDIGGPMERFTWDDEDVFDEALVYPNPVFNSNLSILINASARYSTKATAEILNEMGQVVHHELMPLEYGANYCDINISQLGSGVYFVRVTDGDKAKTVKIMKL